MAKAIGISRESVRTILREAGLRAYEEVKGHLRTEQAKVKRLERCKRLRKRFAAGRRRHILFSDEKWFDVEQAYNHQNAQVWSKGKPPLEERMIVRTQKPKQVMVWAGITYTGKTPLFLVPEEVKVQRPQYRAILENKVLPWARQHFGGKM
ncbi:hypothetical protein Y032_0109g85 [Ancylostoma ceylanicum]|uniref:Transposase n=1 Tax=Ancylostoma ceylanicum TaxID=53326 RepID=A0A016TEZ7_9BILA|nr:hypothetical protein Y032_0109g85 [Ancylostoma ceylanicum]